MINFSRVAVAEVIEIVSIVDELRSTSSTNEKKAILERNKNNEGLQTILELTYSPFKKYKLTEKTLVESDGEEVGFDNLRIATHTLANSNIDNDLRMSAMRFIDYTDEEIRDLYRCVLLKDLKIGVNASTINKVWKGLIPTSETGMEIKPMLANKFNFDKPPKCEFAITEKLDGIRCLIVVKNGHITLYTRQGKTITGCTEIEDGISTILSVCKKDNLVFDGELIATGCTYKDVYKETTKRVKNKNSVKTGIQYKAFDILTLKEFENRKCTKTYEERMTMLHGMFLESSKLGFKSELVRPLGKLYIGSDIEVVFDLLEEYRLKGAEGLMVNLTNAMYEFKRSNNILKVKVMETVDLRIIGFEEGKNKNEGKLGALLVDYKGNTVGVGSGFTDKERKFIWENKNLYLGKIAEISFFEETTNKDSGVSLRFPVWKHLRLDKNEPSLF